MLNIIQTYMIVNKPFTWFSFLISSSEHCLVNILGITINSTILVMVAIHYFLYKSKCLISIFLVIQQDSLG